MTGRHAQLYLVGCIQLPVSFSYITIFLKKKTREERGGAMTGIGARYSQQLRVRNGVDVEKGDSEALRAA